jgi:SAM-dependent methyltransferase
MVEARSIAGRSDGAAIRGTAPDDLRARLHGMWGAVAGGWAEHADFVDSRGAGVTKQMLELTRPRPGERVLELACGPGSVGLAAARWVAPDGQVVLSDVAAEMTDVAAARAGALGVTNVTTAVLDIEEIDQPDGSFDVVLCREGLMFATDHARAAREIRRVLCPGGRVAIAVWGPRERNPWLAIVLDAAAVLLGAPIPPPGVPGPFSLQDAEQLSGLLAGAGLTWVTIGEAPVPLRAASVEEWWTRTCALAGPLAKILDSMPPEAKNALAARAREAARPYETANGLEFPGVTLLASARRHRARPTPARR